MTSERYRPGVWEAIGVVAGLLVSGCAASRDPALTGALANTYVEYMLASRDPAVLVRWPVEQQQTVPVYVQRNPDVVGYRPSYARMLREAFEQWDHALPAIRFAYVGSPSSARVRVRWVRAMHQQRAGQTNVTWDEKDLWIRGARVTLAVRTAGGNQLTETQMLILALHEVGHVLGLGHSAVSDDVMFPESRSASLSERDIATVRLVYRLPTGRL